MDTQTEVSVLHFIGTDGGDWLLAFGVRLDRRSGVNDAHRIKAKCVRCLALTLGAVDFFKVCLASADDSLDRRDRPTQLN